MNETTATIKFIHDTLRVHDTLRTVHAPEAVTWFEIAKWLFGLIITLGGSLSLWKYAFHPRKVAKENAFVAVTDAQQAAESRVIEAESKSDAAKHDTVANIISLWEQSAKTLQEQVNESQSENTKLRAELELAYSQAMESKKKLTLAEADVEILQKKVTEQKFEIINLKMRLAADLEILADHPELQKMVSQLLAEKQRLNKENEKILIELEKTAQ